jgi:hypothetical protein
MYWFILLICSVFNHAAENNSDAINTIFEDRCALLNELFQLDSFTSNHIQQIKEYKEKIQRLDSSKLHQMDSCSVNEKLLLKMCHWLALESYKNKTMLKLGNFGSLSSSPDYYKNQIHTLIESMVPNDKTKKELKAVYKKIV